MIRVFYFSPTGGTKKVAEYVAEGFEDKISFYDILSETPESFTYGKDDGIVLAAPVFAGRIPQVIRERMKGQTGCGTPAAVVAVYGNREYDDALLEMADFLKEQGFTVKTAVAALARHSLSLAVAQGRPDKEDKEQLKEYGRIMQEKFRSGDTLDIIDKIPGKRPYRQLNASLVCSMKNDSCVKCGNCAKVCPTGAVSGEDFLVHDPQSCINCMACVVKCPVKARYMPEQFMTMIQQKLSPLENIRKQNEIF